MRRLIAWVTGRRAAAVPTAPARAPAEEGVGLAMEELANLLQSEDPKDLERLAEVLTGLDCQR
ncbi:MAG: hypothetical protein EWM45_11955 [Rhodopseudomonas palustris]|nr:MAG: hypothetical protein EWM45_11955 [Rhodopseudomonas palustris]